MNKIREKIRTRQLKARRERFEEIKKCSKDMELEVDDSLLYLSLRIEDIETHIVNFEIILVILILTYFCIFVTMWPLLIEAIGGGV